ncbi:hypothetical protein JCM8097_002485 [Rhodosporidiobolus ruineniae]
MFGSSGSTFGGFGQQQQQQQQQQPASGGLFGGAANTGFGSSGFGASSTPAFGAAAQPAQNTGFSGFGATTSSAPAFGATTSSTPAFGASNTTGGGLFGASQPAQPQSTGFSFGGGGTSTFGQTNTASTGTTGGLFGAKPATTGFGGFGQPAQPQQPAATGGLFGGGAAATPAFGAAAQQPGQGTGTAVAPYQATTVMEPPAEEGKPPPANQTAHQFQSITCMPQYKNYSFEELRLQDYQAGRKTASATPAFGSAFGSTSTPAFGAANTGTTGGGLFGASSTPGFGAASTSTPGFGQTNTTGGGLFGSTGATSTFGQPATSQPAAGGGLFGAATSQPAQTGGLFGSAPAAASSPFGQPAAGTTATPAFGGFGAAAAAPKPAGTGFSFGAASTPAAGTTGGGLFGSTPAQQPAANPFGQPAQSAATGGGLFGSQPAAGTAGTTGSFSFGANTAPKPSLFGNTTATSTPAFGAAAPTSTAPKPAFSFGSTPAAGTTGGGLFGAFGATSAAPTTGGLFGGGASTFGQPAQPAAGTSTFGAGGLFGAKPAAPAAGGSLFGGSQPAAGGGLFGSTTAAQPAQTSSLFGSTNTAAPGLGGSLFGSSTAQQPQQQQPTAYASADDANAYGSNPLFASAAAGASPVRPAEDKKKPPIFTAFRGTPVSRSSTKITRLRGFGASSTASPAPGTPLGLGSSLSASVASAAGTPGRASPLRLTHGIGDDVALSPNAFVSRPSVKKLVIKGGLGNGASPDKSAVGGATPGGARAKVSFDPEASSRSTSLFNNSSRTPGAGSGEGEAEVSFASENAGNVTLDSPSLAKTAAAASSEWPSSRRSAAASSPAAKPKHGEYYTVPSLDTLQRLPAAKLRAVPDLVVGRVGYGQVAFSEPVDLTTLDSVEDLLGNVVQLEDRNAVVYGEDWPAPPPGEGLNVPATITLEGCWPVDKATRKPIRDAAHPRVQQHAKRLRQLDQTAFISYEAESGEWVFAVEGF